MSKEKDLSSFEYAQMLSDIKHDIQTAQIRSIVSVNKELIKLYWSIGERIVSRQESGEGRGSAVIEQLAKDLQNAFPGIGGFSRSNIFSMRQLYITYRKVQQASGLMANPSINSGCLIMP